MNWGCGCGSFYVYRKWTPSKWTPYLSCYKVVFFLYFFVLFLPFFLSPLMELPSLGTVRRQIGSQCKVSRRLATFVKINLAALIVPIWFTSFAFAKYLLSLSNIFYHKFLLLLYHKLKNYIQSYHYTILHWRNVVAT